MVYIVNCEVYTCVLFTADIDLNEVIQSDLFWPVTVSHASLVITSGIC